MINWNDLHTLENTRRKGFEQFCYTIAKRKYGDLGTFTPVDDSGGGSGVEFFLTFPDGRVWGWQAKFYPDGRLNDGGRKGQIKKSLQRSCKDHPKLEKWLLCTPMDFTPKERRWFDKTLPSSILHGEPVLPTDQVIELRHWGHTEFNDFLSEEWAAGIYSYYFGELELSKTWFENVYRKAERSPAGKRYTADLHSKSDVSEYAAQAVVADRIVVSIQEEFEQVAEDLDAFSRRLNDVGSSRSTDVTWKGEHATFLAQSEASDAEESLKEALAVARKALEKLQSGEVDLSETMRGVEGQVETLNEIPNHFEVAASKLSEESARREGFDIYGSSVVAPNLSSLLGRIRNCQNQIVHVLGDAGKGKTHLAFDTCHLLLQDNRPAILLLGASIRTREPLRAQLLGALDVPSSYSWQDFLNALNVAAERHSVRIPIVIDGLNESIVDGRLSPVWRDELDGFADEISGYKNLALITTCRTGYVDEIWRDGEPDTAVRTHGFGRETEEAVERYFDYYKIDANLTGASLQHFSHPIYLQIYCETTNPDRENVQHVHLGEQSLFGVFERYIDLCNRRIVKQMDRRPGTDVLRPALNRVALQLWENRWRGIPVHSAILCMDEVAESELPSWEQSLSHAIEDEGLLLSRTWSSSESAEEYEFAYDLMAGYFIASAIISVFRDDLESYLKDEETLKTLFGPYQHRHPLHEDISRCLAAMLPAKRGRYLHDVIREEDEPFNYSVRSLFEIDPSLINAGAVEIIKGLFYTRENRKLLFQEFELTWLHKGHPLGADFIHGLLMEMGMAERDFAWSEYIRERQGREKTDEAVKALHERCSDLSPIEEREESRLHLMALRVTWTLTTTIRPLRDEATRALYWYGRRFPARFFDLLQTSFRINDPYVPERMLAAAYGVAMALQYDFDSEEFVQQHLPIWAQYFQKAMFAANAPCSTTHVLMRDYARHIIDIAVLHHPSLFTSSELDTTQPPYDGGNIEDWGQDTNRPAKDQSVGPILMDFGNYTLGRLVPDRRNYDHTHPVFKKLKEKAFWRIYDLGWTTDRFGNIDREIQRRQPLNRSNEPRKTDRYGKKYSWIAYFELYGHRLDNDAVDQWEKRLSDVDIDPSFPEPPPSVQLIDSDWLGEPRDDVGTWIADGNIPNLSNFAIQDEVLGEKGPWVLLSSFYVHDDADRRKEIWFRVKGALVNPAKVEQALESASLREEVHSARITPGNHYTFAGEVPWSDTFPESRKREIREVLDQRQYSTKGLDIACRDDLSSDELREAVTLVKQDRRAMETSENTESLEDALEVINEMGAEAGLEFQVSEQSYTIDCVDTFSILPAVWRNEWESHHNQINVGSRGDIPNRQICELLGLVSQPQTYDLFDKFGRRATITTDFEKRRGGTKRNQKFLYIRKDLLNRYIEETNQTLLIWMGGERQYTTSLYMEAKQAGGLPDPDRVNFHKVHVYEDN